MTLPWNAHAWLTAIDAGVGGNVRGIQHVFRLQISPKLLIPAIKRIAGHPLKRQAIRPRPVNHLQAQVDLALKDSLRRHATGFPLISIHRGEPSLGQEQFAVDQRPQLARHIDVRQIGAYLTHIDFAQTPVALARRARALLARFGIGALLIAVYDSKQDKFATIAKILIAQALYNKGPAFDPGTDRIVSQAAGDLRKRLIEYYADEGQRDHCVIAIPIGGFVPEFTARPEPEPAAT